MSSINPNGSDYAGPSQNYEQYAQVPPTEYEQADSAARQQPQAYQQQALNEQNFGYAPPTYGGHVFDQRVNPQPLPFAQQPVSPPPPSYNPGIERSQGPLPRTRPESTYAYDNASYGNAIERPQGPLPRLRSEQNQPPQYGQPLQTAAGQVQPDQPQRRLRSAQQAQDLRQRFTRDPGTDGV